MKQLIIADGERRLLQSPGYQVALLKLRIAIFSRYAAELKNAGFFRRWWLRCRIALEYRREKRRHGPSAQSVYSSRQGWRDPSG